MHIQLALSLYFYLLYLLSRSICFEVAATEMTRHQRLEAAPHRHMGTHVTKRHRRSLVHGKSGYAHA